MDQVIHQETPIVNGIRIVEQIKDNFVGILLVIFMLLELGLYFKIFSLFKLTIGN
jgi:hypothetical protein